MREMLLLRFATACFGIIPTLQLWILCWCGIKEPEVGNFIGPGQLGLAIPVISLSVSIVLILWTVFLVVSKSSLSGLCMIHMIVMAFLSIHLHLAAVRIGAFSGIVQCRRECCSMSHKGVSLQGHNGTTRGELKGSEIKGDKGSGATKGSDLIR
jgi:hypothetical protein